MLNNSSLQSKNTINLFCVKSNHTYALMANWFSSTFSHVRLTFFGADKCNVYDKVYNTLKVILKVGI